MITLKEYADRPEEDDYKGIPVYHSEFIASFLQSRKQRAGREPDASFSTKKLCLVATDRTYLAETLFRLSLRPDCYYVKYSTRSKDGMYLGRCFLLGDDAVGELWHELRADPQLMCSVQDDEFTARFRPAT